MPGYKKITGPNGTSDNVGGLTQVLYFCPIGNFTTIAEADTLEAASTLEALTEISDDHTFTGTKGFFKSYCTRDKGNVKGSVVGERDGRGMKQEATFFVPGSVLAVIGGARKMKNDQFIFLFKQANKQYIQVGTYDFPAEVSIEYDTAFNESGVRGTTFKVSGFESGMYFYTGEIVEDTTV